MRAGLAIAVVVGLGVVGCGNGTTLSPVADSTVPSTTETSDIEPTTTPTTAVDSSPSTAPQVDSGAPTSPILRPKGIGPFVFDDNATDVESWLTNELGPADVSVTDRGAIGWPLVSCDQRRAAYWAEAGLTVVFADRDSSGSCTSTPQLAAWMLYGAAPWFAAEHGTDLVSVPGYVTTDAEIGLGSAVAALRVAYPDVEFGEWDIDEYSPSAFRVEGMEGRIDWNPIFDVQVALNEFGAALEVDGIPGPATRQAITQFQTARGITESRGEDVIELVGELGPTTLDALGVAPPAAAAVVYLAAGNWAWDF